MQKCAFLLVCVAHIRHSVCAGRGLMIPRKALLEMITLIKPLLSKLPPNTPCPHPSICSLNTLNQAQVCLDAFTDASIADRQSSANERGDEAGDVLPSFLSSVLCGQKCCLRMNVNDNKFSY